LQLEEAPIKRYRSERDPLRSIDTRKCIKQPYTMAD